VRSAASKSTTLVSKSYFTIDTVTLRMNI
jgi:hypothetical protein